MADQDKEEIRKAWLEEVNKMLDAGQGFLEGRWEQNHILDFFLNILDQSLNERVEEIRKEIDEIEVKESAPFSASDEFREKAKIINEYLMPQIKKALLSLPSLQTLTTPQEK